MAKDRILLYNPTADMDLPKVGKRLPRNALTAKVAEAILEVLYSTGVRRQETVNLRLYDVDLENRTVFIREGKGKNDRVVPIGERACLWLSKYLREVRPRLVVELDPQVLFLTHAGDLRND